jgi:hypothetical protein
VAENTQHQERKCPNGGHVDESRRTYKGDLATAEVTEVEPEGGGRAVSSGSLRYYFTQPEHERIEATTPRRSISSASWRPAVVESRAAPPAAEPPTEADPLEQLLVRLEAAQLSPLASFSPGPLPRPYR